MDKSNSSSSATIAENPNYKSSLGLINNNDKTNDAIISQQIEFLLQKQVRFHSY